MSVDLVGKGGRGVSQPFFNDTRMGSGFDNAGGVAMA